MYYCNTVFVYAVACSQCILVYYYRTGARPTKLVPMQNESMSEPYSVLMALLRCRLCFALLRASVMCLRISAVLIDLRLYLYISGCTYKSPTVFIYMYISGCTYISPAVFISLAVCTYLQFYTILTQMAPEDFDTNGAAYINSGCFYISPAVYTYISPVVLIIFISPAVFIYLRLYLYISGCIYISLAVFTYLQFDIILTQMAPEDFDTNGAAYINSGCIYISLAVLIYLLLYL